MARTRHAVLLSLLLTACGPGKSPFDSRADESGSSDSGSTTTTTQTSTTVGFVPPNDQFVTECDPFGQTCPDGEKCVPYASSGDSWDTFKCVLITGEQATGEPCTYGGASDPTDDCDELGGCWSVQDVDGELVGTCHAFCMGTADNPECPPGSNCSISGSGIPAYCIPTCDPLAQDCGPGLGCFFSGADFQCIVSVQSIPPGEPCGFINDCAPGLLCASAELLPACNGSACCVLYCNLDLGDAQCDATPGTTCQPFFQNDTAPPGLENVGVCIVPSP